MRSVLESASAKNEVGYVVWKDVILQMMNLAERMLIFGRVLPGNPHNVCARAG